MAYCTVADIQAKLQHVTIDDTSNPSRAEVGEFIAQTDALVDARLNALGIATPVTDSDKLLVLKPIVVSGVVAEVLRSLEMESEEARSRQELFEGGLRTIERNPGILQTAEGGGAPGFHDASSDTRRFIAGREQW